MQRPQGALDGPVFRRFSDFVPSTVQDAVLAALIQRSLNAVAGVTRTTMEDLMKGVWPFLLAELAVLALLILFPALVTVPAKWLSG